MTVRGPERRIRVLVAYDGTDFHGWQVQPGRETIQGTLEQILHGIEGRPVAVHGSGRTDAGVHAEAQVAAFSITNPIPPDNLRRAINRLLPPAIRVWRVEEAALDFHPRFDAIAKTYEYRLFREEICPPIIWRYVHHHPFPVAAAAMQSAAGLLTGEHDFRAFATADASDSRVSSKGNSDVRSKVRRIFASTLEERTDLLIYRVRGSGFLKHMVRRIVGTLLEVGKGNLTLEDVERLLTPVPGTQACRSAPAKGLHLMSVEYPLDSVTRSVDRFSLISPNA